MNDELKSAWELALEKMDSQEEMSVTSLSEEQKAAIAEVRSKYAAKIAEEEISIQSKLSQALQKGEFDEVQKLQGLLTQERDRFNRQMEREIEKIREEGSPESD